MKEFRSLAKDAIEDIKVNIDESNMTQIEAEITGPVGTPYEGGTFVCKLVLGADFPQSPPKGTHSSSEIQKENNNMYRKSVRTCIRAYAFAYMDVWIVCVCVVCVCVCVCVCVVSSSDRARPCTWCEGYAESQASF
jgi:ubiquitin-protein ligase